MSNHSNANADTLEWRVDAARASGGISGEPIYRMIERIIVKCDLKGKVLDYGAGTGTLSRRLATMQRFAEVHAADIMDMESVPEGVVFHKQDLNEPLAEYDRYFDLIVASEVIEHLENPRFVLRELYRLCAPGGHVIVTTPNNESLRSLIALFIRGHYVAFSDSCYPAHITALVRKDLTRIFKETGFEPPVFRFTNYGSLPSLTRLSWQQISFGLLKGLRFSENVLALGRKPL